MLPFRAKPPTGEAESPNSPNNSAPLKQPIPNNSEGVEEATRFQAHSIPDEAIQVSVSRHDITPPIAPSEALQSSGGGTFSSVTGVADTSMLRFTEGFLNLDSTYDQRIRHEELEIDGHEDVWAFLTHPRPLNIRPGAEVQQSTGDLTKACATTIGDTAVISMITTSTESLDPNEPLEVAIDRRTKVAQAEADRHDALVNHMVKYYWRTHPPQRSAKRNGAVGNSSLTNNTEQSQSSQATTGQSSRWQAYPHQRRRVDTGGSGSGDEDDQGDSNHAPPASRMPSSHYFACPFKKWRPQHYRSCNGFQSIAKLKQHLKSSKHYLPACPRCHVACGDKAVVLNHLRVSVCLECEKPHCLISDEQLAFIMKRSRCKESWEDQWRALFAVLFPNHPQPSSVYVVDETRDLLEHMFQWSRALGEQELSRFQEVTSRHDPFPTPSVKINEVWDSISSVIIAEYTSKERLFWDFTQAQQASGRRQRSADMTFENNRLTKDSLAQVSGIMKSPQLGIESRLPEPSPLALISFRTAVVGGNNPSPSQSDSTPAYPPSSFNPDQWVYTDMSTAANGTPALAANGTPASAATFDIPPGPDEFTWDSSGHQGFLDSGHAPRSLDLNWPWTEPEEVASVELAVQTQVSSQSWAEGVQDMAFML